MKAFVTGIEGFVGYHLAKYLSQGGWDVLGTYIDDDSAERVAGFDGISLRRCDITDGKTLTETVEDFQPDVVFHLAAVTFVPRAGSDPTGTFMVNVIGSVNLLEAIRKLSGLRRIVMVGSAEIYGKVDPLVVPVIESIRPGPASIYGVTKYSMELASMRYADDFGMDVVVTRSFNHTGPMQRSDFVASAFAKQIAMIEVGLKEPVIEVGNLEPMRDFTDVRDIVGAYHALAVSPEADGVYNVCSGKGTTIRRILDLLLECSDVEIHVETDPARMRKSDVPVMIGDNSRLKSVTGWEPVIPLRETLEDLLDWWRSEIKNKNDIP